MTSCESNKEGDANQSENQKSEKNITFNGARQFFFIIIVIIINVVNLISVVKLKFRKMHASREYVSFMWVSFYRAQ